MAYISSNTNRWYCAIETAYGQIPGITAANRIPAVSMTARHQKEKALRRDKTGTRTWAGVPQGIRRQTSFTLTSYMRDWADQTLLPPQGPLFEAALGNSGLLWSGGTPTTGTDTSTVKFGAPHGLVPGQAIASAGEIRFVAAVADNQTVVLNAPFSSAPVPGVALGASATYTVARELPSVTLFDYWDPTNAVQRVMPGSAVDRLTVKLNGDFHEFDFRGMAKDLIDSSSFQSGQGGVTAFPSEPAPAPISYSPVPGNLGQVWLGVIPTQFFTVSAATIELRNNLQMRNQEFGSILPRGINPGSREVLMTLELFGQDDDATAALYQASRGDFPINVMFQLGQNPGQMAGIYLKSLIPAVPEFDDGERRLRWMFRDTRAQGTFEDEIIVAFA